MSELELIKNLSLTLKNIDDEKLSMSPGEWDRIFKKISIDRVEDALRFLREKLEWAENFTYGDVLHDEVKTSIWVKTNLTNVYPDGMYILNLDIKSDKDLYDALFLAREYINIIPQKISMLENCLMYLGHT